jgi:hypothetical protein
MKNSSEAREVLSASLERWESVMKAILTDVEEIPERMMRREPLDVDMLAQEALKAIKKLKGTVTEVAAVRSNLDRLGELLEVSRREADYKGVIVNAWPRNVVADKMTYLGAALVAAGSAAFAIVGFPSLTDSVVLVPVTFWGLGIVLLIDGLWSLRRWERHRWAYFRKQFGVPELGAFKVSERRIETISPPREK